MEERRSRRRDAADASPHRSAARQSEDDRGHVRTNSARRRSRRRRPREREALWTARKTGMAATDARRRTFDERTIDRVDVDAAQSEKDHRLESDKATDAFFEGKRVREARGGWFAYQLTVAPDRPVTIVCAFRGSEGRRRSFDILVDGETIASDTLEYHPTEQLDREYAVPVALTRGKSTITVKFQAQ